jgi:hypothetical protein
MALRIRRGTDAQRAGVLFESGEVVWTTDLQQLWVGDGTNQGGKPVVGLNVAGYGLTYNNTSHRLEVAGLSADDLTDGVNNKFASAERVQDLVGPMFTSGSHTGITFQYNDNGAGNGVINATIDASAFTDIVGLTSIVNDTEPLLGGTLNLNEHDINGSGNIDISGDITANTIYAANAVSADLISASTGLGASLPLNGHNIIGNGNINITGLISVNLTDNLLIHQILDEINPKGFITTTLSRGTLVAPAAIHAGDELGGLLIKGYTNSSTSAISGLISFIVDDTAVIAGGNFIKSKIVLSAATDTTQDPSNAFILDSAGVASVNTVSVGDGSAAHPSVRFSTDGSQDSGLFHPADGVVCVSTNGVERARIDGGGIRSSGFIKVANVSGSLPNPPEAGMIVLDGTTFKGYNGSSWVNLN